MSLNLRSVVSQTHAKTLIHLYLRSLCMENVGYEKQVSFFTRLETAQVGKPARLDETYDVPSLLRHCLEVNPLCHPDSQFKV